MSKASLIISASPKRDYHLDLCLKALSVQNTKEVELIIVDDGSEGIAQIISAYEKDFPQLQYLWRANDENISRSRNLGARHAKTENLIFLNCDVLFHPHVISYYLYYLNHFPHATFWGYVGCRKNVFSPSLWFEKTQVNWLDFRFFPLNASEIYVHPDIQKKPHTLAGGHHFAMQKEVFDHIGGFDETFQAWGEEDVELALRGHLKGHPIYFLGDCWAEHVVHDYTEVFHQRSYQELRHKLEKIMALEDMASHLSKQLPSTVFFSFERSHLFEKMQSHYLKYNPRAIQDELRSF